LERGFVKIFRKFFEDNELWKEKRVFSKAEAWLDVVRSARWKDEPKRMIDKRGPYILEQGDMYISDRFLAKRWLWSPKKVRTFLNYLIERPSIKYKTRTTRRTIINVINIKGYLEWRTSERTSEEPRGRGGKGGKGSKKEPSLAQAQSGFAPNKEPQRNHRGTTEEPKKKHVKKEKNVNSSSILSEKEKNKTKEEAIAELKKKIPGIGRLDKRGEANDKETEN
jgi:hypothetical protein